MKLDLLLIGLAGSAGAIVRYLTYVAERTFFIERLFPAATLAINAIGCFLLGLLMTYLEQNTGPFQRSILLAGAVGFLGSFTTFSTFGFETFKLIQTGQTGVAILNILLNVLLGLAGVGLGVGLGKIIV